MPGGHRSRRTPGALGPRRAIPSVGGEAGRCRELARGVAQPQRGPRQAAVRSRAPPARLAARCAAGGIHVLAERRRRPVWRRQGGRQAPAHDDSLPSARERRRRHGRRGRTRGGHTQDPASARVRTWDVREGLRRRRSGPAHAGGPAVRAGDSRRREDGREHEKHIEKARRRRRGGDGFAIPGGPTGRRGGARALSGVDRRAGGRGQALAPGRRAGRAPGCRRRRGGRDGGEGASRARRLGSGRRPLRLRDRPPGAPPARHLVQPARFDREKHDGNETDRSDDARVRGARRSVPVRAAFARAGRAALRFAARTRPGGARRRLESVPARRRRAAPGAGPRRRGLERRSRRRDARNDRRAERPGGGGCRGGRRGGHQGLRRRRCAGPLGPRVDKKRERVRGRALRVPGAQLACRAGGDQPPRGALPVSAAVFGAALRGRVQARGPVRERVAPDARGGAAVVGVRRGRARPGAGRHRGAAAPIGGGVRHARRGSARLGRRA